MFKNMSKNKRNYALQEMQGIFFIDSKTSCIHYLIDRDVLKMFLSIRLKKAVFCEYCADALRFSGKIQKKQKK